MEWKIRLINEYADLKEKIGELDTYLANNFDFTKDMTEKDSKRYDVMNKQLDVMERYYEILQERILLEMSN